MWPGIIVPGHFRYSHSCYYVGKRKRLVFQSIIIPEQRRSKKGFLPGYWSAIITSYTNPACGGIYSVLSRMRCHFPFAVLLFSYRIVVLSSLQRDLFMLSSQPDIQHFYQKRESDHRIDITFADLLMKALGHEHDSNGYQEGQRQHLQGRVAVDKPADTSCKNHHQNNGDDHGNDHDEYFFHQANGGQYRVKRKNSIDQYDLQYHRAELGINFLLGRVGRFLIRLIQLMMYLQRNLKYKEYTTSHQDKVFPADFYRRPSVFDKRQGK